MPILYGQVVVDMQGDCFISIINLDWSRIIHASPWFRD